MNKDKIKSLLYLFGKMLGFLGLGYLIYKITQEYTLESFLNRVKDLTEVIFYVLILNFISALVGIYGWHKIIGNYSKMSVDFITSFYYYAKTDISKYLPGNVFHLLGRQAIASIIGISQKDMAKVSLIQTLMLLVATVISATLFAVISYDIHTYIKWLMLLASIVSVLVLFFMFPKFNKIKKLKFTSIFSVSIGMNGLIFALIVYFQLDSMSISLFFKIASIYILSWLIGFVTPGASGGLGVREAAFIAIANFIHLNLSMEIILFSILFIRLTNIVGDILMFLITLFIGKRVIK